MAKLKIESYGFGELAEAYYPDREYSTAVRLFNRDLHLTRGMWPEMVAQGYKENTKVLTRAQVKVIVKFLGDP